CLGQIGDGQFAFQQVEFEPEADDYVQVVGDLVRLRADERGFDAVDRMVEGFGVDAGQLLGEGCLQRGEVVLPETGAASDDVFPQPRLAFVDAARRAGIEYGGCVGGVDAEFVERVAGLV